MKTLLRIVIILAVVLAVAGALYAFGQSEWATAQLTGDLPALAEGGSGGRPMPDLSIAAATLGVTTEALTAALGGFPPDYAAAAMTLSLAEADVQAAVEASLGGLRGGGERSERGGGGFNVASLAAFARILLPMVIVIAAVSGLRALWERSRRRRQPAAA